VTDYEWLCEVDEKKVLDIGCTYRNSKSYKEFIVAISEVVRANDIEGLLHTTKFIIIMSDGSDCLRPVLYQRLGSLFFFLGLVDCETADTKGIFNAIMTALTFSKMTREDFLLKIMSFAVNTGVKNGLIGLFRERKSI